MLFRPYVRLLSIVPKSERPGSYCREAVSAYNPIWQSKNTSLSVIIQRA